MLTAWPAEDHAIVVAIGRHDQSGEDVYTFLLEALGLDVPDVDREKPPCCDDAGQPPDDPDIAARIAQSIERLTRTRRRVRSR
jgi:hypothetical protein